MPLQDFLKTPRLCPHKFNPCQCQWHQRNICKDQRKHSPYPVDLSSTSSRCIVCSWLLHSSVLTKNCKNPASTQIWVWPEGIKLEIHHSLWWKMDQATPAMTKKQPARQLAFRGNVAYFFGSDSCWRLSWSLIFEEWQQMLTCPYSDKIISMFCCLVSYLDRWKLYSNLWLELHIW